MRGEIIKGMGYDIFVGTPLNKPDGFITDATTAGFSLYYQF
jgi:hemolysin activation/secretion protein